MTELDGVLLMEDRTKYWSVLACVAAGGLVSSSWAEFGVAGGRSCRHWLHAMSDDARLFAFDSWEGLPEPWDKGAKVMPKGAFAQSVPQFLIDDPRVEIVRGWFTDTLPYPFPEPLQFCHVDSDLYSSASAILTHVDEFLVDGTVIAFDEMWDWKRLYPTWKEGEYQAYMEWKERTGKQVEWFLQTVGGSAGWVRV